MAHAGARKRDFPTPAAAVSFLMPMYVYISGGPKRSLLYTHFSARGAKLSSSLFFSFWLERARTEEKLDVGINSLLVVKVEVEWMRLTVDSFLE